MTRHEVQLAADERQANGLPQLPTPQLQEQVRLEKKQIELDIAVARAKEEKALRKREENRKRSLEAKRNSHKPCRRGRLTITSTKEGFRELVAGYRGTTATPPDYFTDLSEAHQALVVRAASDFFIPGGDFTFLKDMVLSLPADERKRFFKEVRDLCMHLAPGPSVNRRSSLLAPYQH